MTDWIHTDPGIRQLPCSLSTPEQNRSIFIHHDSLPPERMTHVFRQLNEQEYVCCADFQGRVWAIPRHLYDSIMDRWECICRERQS